MAGSHILAIRAIFKKKGNLALSQIPFKFCDGAEEGTRILTGSTPPFHLFHTEKAGCLHGGYVLLALSVQFGGGLDKYGGEKW